MNVPPRGNVYSEMFLRAEPGSTNARIQESNMDDTSFVDVEEGLQLLVDKPLQAYFYIYDIILGVEEFTCKVTA